MAATTGPSTEPTSPLTEPTALVRFDRGERVLHWVNASLFAVMFASASALYVPALSSSIGRRELVKTVHVWAGLALPLPVLLTYAARGWGAAFRTDVRRFNRWSPADRRWLRMLSRGREARSRARREVQLGKFNPGQKLNAAFTAGAILVMLGTGAIMNWPRAFPLAWRTGATFVHDCVFFALVCTVTGHIGFAFSDPDSLRSMVRGRVSARWARDHAPAWYDEVRGSGGAAAGGGTGGETVPALSYLGEHDPV